MGYFALIVVFFFAIELVSAPVDPEVGEPVGAVGEEAENSLIFEELFGATHDDEFRVEGDVTVEEEVAEKQGDVLAGLHCGDRVENSEKGDGDEVEQRHQKNSDACRVKLVLFAEKGRENKPERSRQKEERAHNHVVARVLVRVGQNVLEIVKRAEERESTENAVDGKKNFHPFTRVGDAEGAEAFYKEGQNQVDPEENIHLHGNPQNAGVVAVEQNEDADDDPNAHVADHEHARFCEEGVAVGHVENEIVGGHVRVEGQIQVFGDFRGSDVVGDVLFGAVGFGAES